MVHKIQVGKRAQLAGNSRAVDIGGSVRMETNAINVQLAVSAGRLRIRVRMV